MNDETKILVTRFLSRMKIKQITKKKFHKADSISRNKLYPVSDKPTRYKIMGKEKHWPVYKDVVHDDYVRYGKAWLQISEGSSWKTKWELCVIKVD